MNINMNESMGKTGLKSSVFYRVLKWIGKKFKHLFECMCMKNKNENNPSHKVEFTFQSLASEIIEPLNPAYLKALDFALKGDDILNIGITGVYGAGKTSLWRSYVHKKKNLKIITVSLGNYDNDNEIEKIDKQIINQIIAQIPSSKTPLSKYIVKSNRSPFSVLLNAVVTFFLLFSILFLAFPETLKKFELFDYIYGCTVLKNAIVIFLGVSIFYLLVMFFWKNRLRLRKITLHGRDANIEAEESPDEMDFDKDMLELLYIIKSGDIKLIVFEDLDRFNSVKIYSRLRELNFLLNSTTKKNNEKIKFIYMLRDGIFDKEDRTKFFDFILPVVPVLDSNNSKSELLQLLRTLESKNTQDILNSGNDGKISSFEKKVLKLSIFIDDMRLLKNIINEYYVYINIVPTKDLYLEKEKMLALIALKNIMPKEFDELQKDRGYIVKLFKELNKIKEEEIEELKNDDVSVISEIDKLKLESLRERLIKLTNYEIKSIKNRIMPISNQEEDTRDEQFNFILFLVREGLIDESYRYYKGCFREGSLGINDTLFLKNISSGIEQDVLLEIENPQLVMEYLEEIDYRRINILNKNLFIYLVSKEDNDKISIINDLVYDNDIIGKLNLIFEDFLKNTEQEKPGELIERYLQILLDRSIAGIRDNKLIKIILKLETLYDYSIRFFLNQESVVIVSEIIKKLHDNNKCQDLSPVLSVVSDKEFERLLRLVLDNSYYEFIELALKENSEIKNKVVKAFSEFDDTVKHNNIQKFIEQTKLDKFEKLCLVLVEYLLGDNQMNSFISDVVEDIRTISKFNSILRKIDEHIVERYVDTILKQDDKNFIILLAGVENSIITPKIMKDKILCKRKKEEEIDEVSVDVKIACIISKIKLKVPNDELEKYFSIVQELNKLRNFTNGKKISRKGESNYVEIIDTMIENDYLERISEMYVQFKNHN